MFLFEAKKTDHIFCCNAEESIGLVNSRAIYPGNYLLSSIQSNDDKGTFKFIIHHENVDPNLLMKAFDQKPEQTMKNDEDVLSTSKKRRLNEDTWKNSAQLFYLIYQATKDAGQLEKAKQLRPFKFFYFFTNAYWSSSNIQAYIINETTYIFQREGKTIGYAINWENVWRDGGEIRCGFFQNVDKHNFAFILTNSSTNSRTVLTDQLCHCSMTDFFYETEYRNYSKNVAFQENRYYGAGSNGFDFSRLPTDLFLEILSLLPWRERARCRRVSRCWTSISDLALRDDTAMIFETDEDFKGMKAENFERLLSVVADRVVTISIRANDPLKFNCQHLISSPRLESLMEIFLGTRSKVFNSDVVFSILDNCPNLRELTVFLGNRISKSTTERSRKVYDSLEKLDLIAYDMIDPDLMAVADYFPKLTWFRVDEFFYLTESCMSAFVERYGDQLSHLEFNRSVLDEDEACFDEESLRWRPFGAFTGINACRNLNYLSLRVSNISDTFLHDLSTGFENLETLSIEYSRMVTSSGLGALSSHPKLKRFNINNNLINDFSLGIIKIAKEGRLEQLSAQECQLSSECMKTCVCYCPNLILLHACDNENMTVDDAVEIATLYGRYGQAERLVVRSCFKIWKSKRVRQIRNEIKGGKFGRQRHFVLDKRFDDQGFLRYEYEHVEEDFEVVD